MTRSPHLPHRRSTRLLLAAATASVLLGPAGTAIAEPADPARPATEPGAPSPRPATKPQDAPASGADGSGPSRVLLIVVDTLRRDYLSAYGGYALTPQIDRIARRGRTYDAVSSFHQTTMSMAAMMTGHTPSIEAKGSGQPLPWTSRSFCGLARFASSDDDPCIPESVPTLAEDLAAAGYWTAAVVSNPLLYRPYGYDRGFEVWTELGVRREPGETPTWEMKARWGEAVNQGVGEVLDGRPRDRFFLYVHYIDVHDHLVAEPKGYGNAVRRLDHWIGELMARLEADGLVDGLQIVLASDHGERLGEEYALPGTRLHFGNPSFEAVLRVPLIVAPPPALAPREPVRSEDVGDLIRGIVGLPRRNDGGLRPDELYLSEVGYRTYRKGRWKSMWQRGTGRHHLFDLKSDPGEETDVARQNRGIVKQHKKRMKELAAALASDRGQTATLSAEDEARLRALGYID